MEKSLSLSEKLYLLAVHPQKGGIIFAASQKLDFALIGALFLELMSEGKIKFENKRIVVLNSKSDDSIQNYLLQKINNAKRPQKISSWVSKFRLSIKKIRRHIKKNLVQKRLLRMEAKQFLFFHWEIPVLLNKQTVYKMQSEIENMLFQGTHDEENIMLLSMIKPAGLLKRIFPEKERRKSAEKKLKQITQTNLVSKAVSEAIAATQAVAVAVAASSAAAASTTSR